MENYIRIEVSIQQILEKEKIVNNYLDMPPAEELEKGEERPCSAEALACQRKAKYNYEYKIEEDKKIEVWGESSTIKSGKYKDNVIFIKNLAGKWQIYRL